MRLKTKNVLTLVTVLFALISATAYADMQRALDNAIDQASKEVADKLRTTSFENIKTIVVLPLWEEGGDAYVTDTIKSYLTGSPYSLMARSDDEWDKLLGEIKWNTLREDIMNPQTVQSFGKIEGCDAIVYGTVRQREVNSMTFHAIARMTVHMADVETGEILWSSKPVTASVWLEWPEIFQLALHHPVVWIVCGILALIIVWTVIRKTLIAATRPR